MKKSWFEIKNKTGDDTGAADIFVYDEIGRFGVSAKDFAEE